MIKDYVPVPFDGDATLPTYATDVKRYTLIGTVPDEYKIRLAELEVGRSVSAGKPLSHALFRSYTDHGEQMKVTRARIGGNDSELIAVRNAMQMAGVEFYPALPNSCETILYSLGTWMQSKNSGIDSLTLVSQSCH